MDRKLASLIARCLVVGVPSVSVGAEFSMHEDKPEPPHAQYLVIAPGAGLGNNNANIALDNTRSVTLTVEYHPAPLNLEQLIPHDRLIVQTDGLLKK